MRISCDSNLVYASLVAIFGIGVTNYSGNIKFQMYDRNQRGDNKKGVEWEESGDDSGF